MYHRLASSAYFRTNPPQGLRRGTARPPLSPRRPKSQDSRNAFPVVEAFGGRVVLLACNTRTLVLPYLISFGGLESVSKNLRFLFVKTFSTDSGGVRSRVTSSTANTSSGSKAGRGVLLELLDFTGEICFSSIMAADSGAASSIEVAWGTVGLIASGLGSLTESCSPSQLCFL